ncbi:MAG: GNAT family N-acetyltransferase [Paracoccus sp. (in: a-proteobacteria)]|uniref:GNAT family N-acetyltransferase n=1 Tax=Paracoccus sp. TaxID=267 RepID=UPI00391997CC
MSVTVRPLGPDDEEAWKPLWRAYLAFYETELPDEVYSVTFQRLTDPARPAQFGLIAEMEGRAVGLVHVIVHPHNWRIEDVCYLQDLFVTPPARGTGAGRALIEAVYAAADTMGAPTVYWTTQEFNHAARQLYDRIGKVTPFIKYQR